MEEKLEEVSRKTVIWEAVADQATKRIRLELPILFAKTGSLEASVGKRVKSELSGAEAPTVWSSIASLTSMLHKSQSLVQDTYAMSVGLKNEITQDVDKYVDNRLTAFKLPEASKSEMICELSQYFEQKVNRELTSMNTNLNLLKSEIFSTFKEIGIRFHETSS
jgi:hypothetical protein